MPRYDVSPFTGEMERVDSIAPVGSSVTASQTLTTNDEYIPVSPTTSNITLTLPQSEQSIAGKLYRISKRDSSSYEIIIKAASGDTINGKSEVRIAFQYTTLVIVCNGDGTWSIS